ncbi:uncharacterized protein LOC112588048 [Harpegnathos saltator]|uniref:uncharacterized protein LOC112588048 n=1 Tax=Harpegnathos saltator TaxID=610380 RepID=UPI000DBED598|nr:uncharacterized protein LOC112588048 [Harpegnathos saltator]XP_025153632.1 uncharacterized protein LOC112588048 [Harpegnathos saltator]
MSLCTNKFNSIEFEDGLQVIPDNWIQKENNECLYPNYKTDKDIDAAIRTRQTPQDNWLLYPIKRIFGTYESYNEARNKLKKAEIDSDITDTDKAQRKIKARKVISSDDDIDDDDDDDDDHENNCQTRLPSYPKAPKVYRNTKHVQKEHSKHCVSNNRSSLNASTSHKSMFAKQAEHDDIDTCNRTIMNDIASNRIIPAESSAIMREDYVELKNKEYIAIKNYFQRIERMLIEIKFDINCLTEQYQHINNKCFSNEAQERHNSTPTDELSELSFPLKTIEEVESLERILTSNGEGIKEHMFNILAMIGGS